MKTYAKSRIEEKIISCEIFFFRRDNFQRESMMRQWNLCSMIPAVVVACSLLLCGDQVKAETPAELNAVIKKIDMELYARSEADVRALLDKFIERLNLLPVYIINANVGLGNARLARADRRVGRGRRLCRLLGPAAHAQGDRFDREPPSLSARRQDHGTPACRTASRPRLLLPSLPPTADTPPPAR